MNYTIKNDEIADFNESEAFEFPKLKHAKRFVIDIDLCEF